MRSTSLIFCLAALICASLFGSTAAPPGTPHDEAKKVQYESMIPATAVHVTAPSSADTAKVCLATTVCFDVERTHATVNVCHYSVKFDLATAGIKPDNPPDPALLQALTETAAKYVKATRDKRIDVIETSTLRIPEPGNPQSYLDHANFNVLNSTNDYPPLVYDTGPSRNGGFDSLGNRR